MRGEWVTDELNVPKIEALRLLQTAGWTCHANWYVGSTPTNAGLLSLRDAELQAFLGYFMNAGLVQRGFDQPVPANPRQRQGWHTSAIHNLVIGVPAGNLVVFLDPDTGVQPTRCGPEHVCVNELCDYAKAAPVLVYQHRDNNTKGRMSKDSLQQLADRVGARLQRGGINSFEIWAHKSLDDPTRYLGALMVWISKQECTTTPVAGAAGGTEAVDDATTVPDPSPFARASQIDPAFNEEWEQVQPAPLSERSTARRTTEGSGR